MMTLSSMEGAVNMTTGAIFPLIGKLMKRGLLGKLRREEHTKNGKGEGMSVTTLPTERVIPSNENPTMTKERATPPKI